MKTYRFTYSMKPGTREMEICTEYMDSEGNIWSRDTVPLIDITNDIPQCRIINKKSHADLATFKIGVKMIRFRFDSAALCDETSIPNYALFVLTAGDEVFEPYAYKYNLSQYMVSCKQFVSQTMQKCIEDGTTKPSETIKKIALVRVIPDEYGDSAESRICYHVYINIVSFSELQKSLVKTFDAALVLKDHMGKELRFETSVNMCTTAKLVIRDSGEYKNIGRLLLSFLPGYGPDQARVVFDDK